MYLAFKEKLNSLKDDDSYRRRFIERLQVYVVASFWVLLTVLLLYLGHEKESNERGVRVQLPVVGTTKSQTRRSFESNRMKY